MKVLILSDARAAARRAAEIVRDTLAERPAAVLGLATGGTMEDVYARLVEWHRTGTPSFAEVTTFNLDEYVGLPPEHPNSYRATMRQLLFDHVDLALGRTHLPRGDAAEPAEEAARYEAAITGAGGLDLQLLGVGANGHIGFNEPTSSLGSRTRVKTLTEDTRRANARFFAAGETPPRYAITMGIATVMDARHCLLLATGDAKAAAVARMVEGPLGADCPATMLQMHPHATVVLDRSAAGRLRLIDYYQQVHPDGEEPPL